MIFVEDFLRIGKDTVIAIKYIESITYPSGEDLTADKLKDDLHLTVIMTSGKEYNVSVKGQIYDYSEPPQPSSISQLKDEIYFRWRRILSGKA